MSDEEMTPGQEASAPQIQIPDKKPGSSKGLLIVLGAVAGLAVVGGIVAAIVFFWLGSQALPEFEQREQPGAEQPAAQPTEEVAPAAAGPAPAVTNDQVFTFRDIFKPLLSAPTTASPTTTSTPTANDGVTPTTPGTLYLDNIITEDSVRQAVLRLDGTVNTLAAGESIPNTPWRVLRVNETSVVMLYGEVQVTLSVGQGITK